MIKSVKVENEDRYRLYVLKKAYDKMRAYVDLCQLEIGWHGLIERAQDDKGFIMTDVYLLKQEVNSGTTEIDEGAELEHFNSMTREEQDNFMQKNRLWAHSHVNMTASPSGQDDKQGLEHAKYCEDVYIRLITNKKDEYHITFYDKERGVEVITDEINVYDPATIALREQIKEEIKAKVKEKSYTTYKKDEDKETKPINVSNFDSKKKAKQTNVSKLNIKDIFNHKDYKLELLFG